MSYKMPGRYSQDEPSDSEGEESVDISIDAEYESQSEYEESEQEEEEEEDDRRSRRRQSGHNSSSKLGGGRSSRGTPRRSKSDLRPLGSRDSRGDRGSSGGRSSRGLPRRSKTFDGNSSRARMPRRETGGMDKEAIASNRARRLRAMGGGDGKSAGKDRVKLMRRSSSFRENSKRNLLGDSFSNSMNNNDEPLNKDEEEKKDDRRSALRRSNSSDLAPEERQYARTAARGVTRSKSLKAERPNLDKASKNVAARLGKMRVTDGGASGSARPTVGLKF